MSDSATPPPPPPSIPGMPAAPPAAARHDGPDAATDRPVNREPLLPREPAPAQPAVTPDGHQLSRPEPELRRSLEDGLQARIDRAVAEAEARVREELQATQPKPEQPLAAAPDPALMDFARKSLGDDTADDLVQRYASLVENRALWNRARHDPQHADKAPAALRQIEDHLRQLETTAYVDRQKRAERQASAEKAEQKYQLPSTVGEFCDLARQTVTSDYVAEHYPALGAAIQRQAFAVPKFLDGLELHNAATPEQALERLDVALKSTERAYAALASQAAATPATPAAPGNPAITAPTAPAPGGHASRANAVSMAEYEARVSV